MYAVLFPGQGIQVKGMGKDVFDLFPEEVSIANSILGYSIRDTCLLNKKGILNNTLYSQPAIYTVNALHYYKLRNEGIVANYFAGHSLGEYNALLAAGVFSFATGLELVKKRAELMSLEQSGGMAAVIGLPRERVMQLLEQEAGGEVCIANYNSNNQFVISGPRKKIDSLKSIFEQESSLELFFILNTSGAFHSRYMVSAEKEFGKFIQKYDFLSPEIPVISNVTGRPHNIQSIKALLTQQISSPVLWLDTIQYLKQNEVEHYIEVGESKILSNLVKNIYKSDQTEPAAGSDTGRSNGKLSVGSSTLLGNILHNCQNNPDKNLQSYYMNGLLTQVTGAQLMGKVQRLGSQLQKLIQARNSVLLFFPQGPDFGLSILSCWYADLTVVPTPVTDISHFLQKRKQLENIITDCKSNYVLTNDEFHQHIKPFSAQFNLQIVNIDQIFEDTAEILPARNAQEHDTAAILYTSGATSSPKGVELTYNSLMHTTTSPLWCMSEESRVVTWLPQFHAFGITFGLLVPLMHAAEGIFTSVEEFIKDPIIWFSLIHQYKATHTGAPNFAFDYCATHIDINRCKQLRLDSLESLICGGDLIHLSAYKNFQHLFASLGLDPNVLAPNYGMSEAGPLTLKKKGDAYKWVAINKNDLVEKGRVSISAADRQDDENKVVVCCGVTDSNTRIKIVNPETASECKSDEVGEIWVKSGCCGKGYFNNRKASEQAFNKILSDTGEAGYLSTGDLGFLINGELYIVGRKKEVIIVNGKNYYPKDLENEVRDKVELCNLNSAAFSVQKNDHERVIFVQEMMRLESAFDYANIAKSIIAAISAQYSINIYDVVFINQGSLPLTGSKKIQRIACKEQYENGLLNIIWSHEENFTDHASLQRIEHATIIHDVDIEFFRQNIFYLELGENVRLLDKNAPLASIGIDSIGYLRLANRINQLIPQANFKAGMFLTYSTLHQVVEYLRPFDIPHNTPTERLYDYKDPQVIQLLLQCSSGQLSVEKVIKNIKERI